MMMARATRQLIAELDRYAKISHVQGLTVPAHVYLGDVLILRYHQSVIINVIKSKMGTIPGNKRISKHFTTQYWYTIVDNMLKDQDGPRREHQEDTKIFGEMIDYNSFNHIISRFLIADYGITDALRINNIVNIYSQKDIIDSCKIAADNNVHNIAYVQAILERAAAEKQLHHNKIDKLADKIRTSSIILDKSKIIYSKEQADDINQQYKQTRENILLQMMVDKLLGGHNNDEGNT